MEKTLTLRLSGLWTSPNDYTTKEGALDVADNIVIDQTDLGESRRGFEVEIDNAEAELSGYLLRSFTATEPNAAEYDLLTYRLATSVPEGLLLLNDVDDITGDVNFLPPAPSTVARMMNWGKYIYVAGATGIKRVSPTLLTSVPAGIPQALDLVLALTGSSGFFVPNQTGSITATITNTSAILTKISDADIATVLVGQILSGTGIPVGTTVSSITLSLPVVLHVCGLTAGSTTITSVSNASIAAGQLVSGEGIPVNTRVVSIGGGGPYNIVLTNPAFFTNASANITFASDNTITMSAVATSGAPSVITTSISDGAQVAYRLVFGLVNENKVPMLGAPSAFTAITNPTGESRDVTINASIPSGITTDNFYQLYRSQISPSLTIVPADQMQLVVEGVVSGTDISNGYLSITDQTPDSLKGEALYTGTDAEGISQANYPPPISVDMSVFRGYTLYSNFTLEQQLQLAIDGVGSPDGVQTGDIITITSATDPLLTFDLEADSSEDVATGHFEVFTTGTPAQNIADTAASFIRVLNRYADNDLVYAYLLSGPNELPGQMLIQARPTQGAFTVIASAHGTAWTPNIDTEATSEAESVKNGILVAKTQQPEAVPRVNLFRAGGIENEIIRTIPLRDYTIVLTTGGIYRLTGQTVTDFVLEPFDLTVVCVAPETAVPLGNECWCLSTQGVVSISDGGVRMRSALQINATLLALIRGAPISLRDVAFAVGYETDQRYILALPENEGDTTCLQQFCYNYITDRWTRWTRNCTAGYVNTQKGLYLGNGENTNIVKERKNGNYTDYADESFETTIISFDELEVVLDSVTGILEGDLLWQDQDNGPVFSEIVAIDIPSSTVTVTSAIEWDFEDETRIYTAIENVIQWKPNPGDDPTEAKQFSEGQMVMRSPKFAEATLDFATDVSPAFEPVAILGLRSGGSGWGSGPWGQFPWGGTARPQTRRFYIPSNKQYGGMLIVRMTIRSGYSDWKSEGISISINDVSFELGGPETV